MLVAAPLASCGCSETMPQRAQSNCPPDCPPPPIAATAPIGAPEATAVVAAAPPDPNAFDPASITPVIDDPRLSAVKDATLRDQWATAAQAMNAALTANASISQEERARWSFQLGRLRGLGGDPSGAAKAYQDSAAIASPLAGWAHLLAAQWLVGVGQHDAALAELAKIEPVAAMANDLDLVTADALSGKKDVEGAAKRFRAYLARDKHPPQWAPLALRFATMLLEHPNGDARTEEALKLALRVRFEGQNGLGAEKAKDLEKRALAALPTDKRRPYEKPSHEEKLARVKALVASNQTKEALRLEGPLEKLPVAQKAGDWSCELFVAKGEALVRLKKKADAADVYETAIDRCKGRDKRVEALFAGGKASASAGRQLEAKERFAKLEQEFPKHRLADDARLRGAKASLDGNDEPHFVELLASMATDYPDGDMTGDGVFELALHRMEKGDWAAALPTLQQGVARGRDRAYFAAGRFEYFLARARIATGDVEHGTADLAALIQAMPLSYYAGLASARLGERDAAARDKVLAAAFAREPEGTFTVPRGAWCDDPGFLRAAELARQGEARALKLELDKLGIPSRTAPPALLYVASSMLAKAGSITASHGLLRGATERAIGSRVEATDWLDHFPAGRWRGAWELAYPRPWIGVVDAEAKRSAISPALAYAIMREESAFEAGVASGAKAYGLMQLIVPTATKMGEALNLPGDEESLKKPEINIALGCHYLSVLRKEFPDNPLLAIPGYNAGSGAPKKWIDERSGWDFDLWVERIPYDETQKYTKRVMTSLLAYEALYDRDRASEAMSTPRVIGGYVKRASNP
jgi:soluble lytic murein transglycosylase